MTEQDIENNLIQKLTDLGYHYRADIRDRADLEANFRAHFQQLNRVHLSDSEFARLLDHIITPDVFTSSQILRERNSFDRDDGTPLFFTLINITEWCKNTFEVVHQLRINTENSFHRYDVLLLINGVPVTQIELKTYAISPRKAMQQIVDYKNDPGNGYTRTLLSFIQLFIISNQVDTWYFANNNPNHFAFNADEKFLPLYQFADEDNNKITRLDLFANTFLAKCTLAETIARYMVLVATEQKLMLMRPYQVYAVQRIVERIHENNGNGYIWHTTGSGKTLTSFKTSILLKDNPDIVKCLFVVDRKDLDRQTREEFNRFQEGCVEENTNTATLVQRLLSTDYADKVIVTTIQKLGLALTMPENGAQHGYREKLLPLQNARMVFIFDECHRSQFGENHKAIKSFFPNAQLFGFTGTPIFQDNAYARQIQDQQASFFTTIGIFHKELHTYTITDAIEDKNVLRFHIDYYKPEPNAPTDDTPQKQAILQTILQKHNAATANRKFNAIFATASINNAIEYYKLLKHLQQTNLEQDPSYTPLNIACVFSPPAEGNKDVLQIQEDLPQEQEDNKAEPEAKKQALKEIIADYNAAYATNHSLFEFDLYYQDIQKRFKNQQYPNSDVPHSQKIDIIIVVDMLLTGFDSKFLNTLYVDKNLRYHGLIQAFSRTNRVLNDSKPYGNIIDFRQQQDAVNEAIILFSGKDIERSKQIWLVDPAPVVIDRLKQAVTKLQAFMEEQGLPLAPEQVANLKGDTARAAFITAFNEVQRLEIQLDQYTDLTPQQTAEIQAILPPEQLQGFRTAYLETARQLSDAPTSDDPEPVQLDFEFVLFASALIDYDYIIGLLASSTIDKPEKQKLTRQQLINLILSDAKFIEESQDLIEYINSLPTAAPITEAEVRDGYERFKTQKNNQAITAIAQSAGIHPQHLNTFVANTLNRLVLDEDQLADLFADQQLGWKQRVAKKLALMAQLAPLLTKMAAGRPISGISAYLTKSQVNQ